MRRSGGPSCRLLQLQTSPIGGVGMVAVRDLGLQQFGRRQGIGRRMVRPVARQTVAAPAVGQPDRRLRRPPAAQPVEQPGRGAAVHAAPRAPSCRRPETRSPRRCAGAAPGRGTGARWRGSAPPAPARRSPPAARPGSRADRAPGAPAQSVIWWIVTDSAPSGTRGLTIQWRDRLAQDQRRLHRHQADADDAVAAPDRGRWSRRRARPAASPTAASRPPTQPACVVAAQPRIACALRPARPCGAASRARRRAAGAARAVGAGLLQQAGVQHALAGRQPRARPGSGT